MIAETFRDYIDYEVLSTPKLNGYFREKGGRAILRNNIAKFLFLRSNRLNGFIRDLVPNFIRDVMQEAESWMIGDEKTRTALRRVLCELYVKTDRHAYSCIIQDIRQGRHYNKHVQDFQVTKVSNLVAAAAAAGSLEALRSLANHDHQLLWLHSPTFGYPIVAAAYAGQFEVVKALAKQAVTDKGLSIAISTPGQHTAFRKAICTSIEHGHDEMVKILLKNYGKAFGPASESCMAEWLGHSVATGNKVITHLLQHIPNHAGMRTFYAAFESSCMLGDPDIIRIFFEEGRLEVNGISSHGYPLVTAVQVPWTSMPSVKALLAIGANPDGPAYRGNFRRPLQVALEYRRQGASIALLEAGANVYLVPESAWKPHTKHWTGLEQLDRALDQALLHSFVKSQKPKPLCGELFVSGKVEEETQQINAP